MRSSLESAGCNAVVRDGEQICASGRMTFDMVVEKGFLCEHLVHVDVRTAKHDTWSIVVEEGAERLSKAAAIAIASSAPCRAVVVEIIMTSIVTSTFVWILLYNRHYQ